MKGMQGSIRRRPKSSLTFAGLRRYPRKEFSVEVLAQDSEGWEIPLESFDFSPMGMFVRSTLLFEVGTIHHLIFRGPDGQELFSVHAQIVRVEKDDAQFSDNGDGVVPGMAYEFIDLAEEKRERLLGLARRV